MQALDMPELEDLIIDAIYLDILNGNLDQKHGQLKVEYTIGRDLEPGKIKSVLDTLEDWFVSPITSAATTAAVLNLLHQHLVAVASQNAAEKAYQDKEFAATVRDVLDRQRDNGGRAPSGGVRTHWDRTAWTSMTLSRTSKRRVESVSSWPCRSGDQHDCTSIQLYRAVPRSPVFDLLHH
jgi:COP9 signalosome complex subunit 7